MFKNLIFFDTKKIPEILLKLIMMYLKIEIYKKKC
jgi:hypothetical protein